MFRASTYRAIGQNGVVDLEDLRVAVYRSFADTGRPPEVGTLVERFGTSRNAVVEGLRELARARHVVLDSDDRIVMAHPFAAIPLGFSVMGTSTLWWGGCAWDSFALPHLLPEQSPVLVATSCPACGQAHAWIVGIDAPPVGQQVVHFLVSVAHMWDDLHPLRVNGSSSYIWQLFDGLDLTDPSLTLDEVLGMLQR